MGIRSIEFRGKRVDDGEWVEGYYCPCCFGYFPCQPAIVPKQEMEEGAWRPKAIIPETICQYTGLKDKNGTKIFEGDILRADNGHIGCVAFGGLAQFGKYCKCHKEFESIYPDNETVIGNIHDNPELFREV